ncbi:G-protein coupled receptor [Apiospora arundinis]
MKTAAILATTFAATALAVPTLDAVAQCPKNDAQPDGYLPTDPKDTVSPSLLLQISAKEPNKKYAASNTAEITPGDQCTIFNLDLPVKNTQNKVCNLVFDLPEQAATSLSSKALAMKKLKMAGEGEHEHHHEQPHHGHGHGHGQGGKGEGKGEGEGEPHKNYPRITLPSPLASALGYVFDGPGHFNFTGYAIGVGAAAGETTYANQPELGPNPPLPANLTSVKVSGSLCSSDTHLRFEQGFYGTCPIGFYVVLTDIKK